MPNDNDDLKNQTEEPFSLEENFRQRSYYENYYEDLAEHAKKMDEKGQHEIAEEDRAEMQNVNRILDDLVQEKFDNYDKQQPENQQTPQQNSKEHNAAKSKLNAENRNIPDESKQVIHQQDIGNDEITVQEKDGQSKVEDIPQEDLIPVDKSHFTEEALEAQARADEQLATEEAAMDDEIKRFYADHKEEKTMETGENQMNHCADAVDQQISSDKANSEMREEIETASEEEDYNYGYGM